MVIPIMEIKVIQLVVVLGINIFNMKRAMLKSLTHRRMIIGDFHVSDKKQ